MFAKLPAAVRTPLVMLLIAASTVVHTLPLFVVALLRWLLPGAAGRACGRVLVRLAESWIAVNAALVRGFTPTVLQVDGGEGLRADGHYLVLANHQSWVDIIVLQTVLNRRMPFMRFFLKRQLIWVPLLGLAWWALDFPFMRRASRRELARRPELALKAMDGALHSVVDVTIAYPAGIPTLLDLVAGRIPAVAVRIRERPIPADLQGVAYEDDPQARVRVQRWINAMWVDKDADLDSLLDPARDAMAATAG